MFCCLCINSTVFSHFCIFLLISLSGPQALRWSAAGVPKCKKVVLCLKKKMPVLDKLHSIMSYSAVDCEFNVNASTVYIKSVFLSRFWAPKPRHMVTAAMKLKDVSWKESYDNPRQSIKRQRHHFADKGLSSQSYGFSSSHVWMWELDHKEGWTPNNWCFQILIRLLRVHWTIRRLKQSILKETNPEYSLERLMLKRKLQYFGHQYEEPTHWKRPWSWERFKAKGEGGGLGWDG